MTARGQGSKKSVTTARIRSLDGGMEDISEQVPGREALLRIGFLVMAVVSVVTFLSRPSDSDALERSKTEVTRPADPFCEDLDVGDVLRGLLANEGYFAGPKISLLLDEFYAEYGEDYDCIDVRIFVAEHTNPFGG